MEVLGKGKCIELILVEDLGGGSESWPRRQRGGFLVRYSGLVFPAESLGVWDCSWASTWHGSQGSKARPRFLGNPSRDVIFRASLSLRGHRSWRRAERDRAFLCPLTLSPGIREFPTDMGEGLSSA